MIVLSKRLQAVASMVTPGRRPVDVGCDHGYVPVYLVQAHIASKVLAMDINKGPLARARENIEKWGLSGQIETRLSDGLKNYSPKEADSLIIAGMGGLLIRDILRDGKDRGILDDFHELILSPHSDAHVVRRCLAQWGYEIDREIMLTDAGKYYTVIHAVKGAFGTQADQNRTEGTSDVYSKSLGICRGQQNEDDEMYGGYLIRHKDPVLYQYLIKQLKEREERYGQICSVETPGARAYRPVLEKELEQIKRVLARF